MKTLLFALIITCISCQKQTDVLNPKLTSEATLSSNKIITTDVKTTVDYNTRIYNECNSEFVQLTGLADVSILETYSDKRYTINYSINLLKITGIGETSGLEYKGGGKIDAKVKSSLTSAKSNGTFIYKTKFMAEGTKLSFTQHAHYVETANGVIKVEFNNISDTCTSK